MTNILYQQIILMSMTILTNWVHSQELFWNLDKITIIIFFFFHKLHCETYEFGLIIWNKHGASRTRPETLATLFLLSRNCSSFLSSLSLLCNQVSFFRLAYQFCVLDPHSVRFAFLGYPYSSVEYSYHLWTFINIAHKLFDKMLELEKNKVCWFGVFFRIIYIANVFSSLWRG